MATSQRFTTDVLICGVRPGDWVLVRPDGYVGAIVSSDHCCELNAYFERVGLSAD
jgi:hypothetical protein